MNVAQLKAKLHDLTVDNPTLNEVEVIVIKELLYKELTEIYYCINCDKVHIDGERRDNGK